MPLGLEKLNVDTVGDPLAREMANGLFDGLDYTGIAPAYKLVERKVVTLSKISLR